MTTPKRTHGGKRIGAGRPLNANPTRQLTLRLPEDIVLIIQSTPRLRNLARAALIRTIRTNTKQKQTLAPQNP